MLKMSYQNEDVPHAKHMEFLHHLGKVSESPRVKGEYSPLVCIVQIVPLYILTKQTTSYFAQSCMDTAKGLLQYCNMQLLQDFTFPRQVDPQ